MQKKNYEFIEGLIKKNLADRDEPNEEIDHFLVPVFDEETFAVNSSLKILLKSGTNMTKYFLMKLASKILYTLSSEGTCWQNLEALCRSERFLEN